MNLRYKFIWLLLSIIVTIVTLLTYLNIKEDNTILNNALENRVLLMKKHLSHNAKYTIEYYKNEIENDLASMNLSHITSVLKQLVDREDIEGVSLVKEDRTMQLFEGRPNHKNVDKLTIEETKDSIVISVPIEFSQYWGTFSLVYSLETLHQEVAIIRTTITRKIKQKVLYAVILGIIVFIIFAIFGLVWVQRIISPIIVLTKTAKNMAEGNLSGNEVLLHIDRKDEVGTLAKAFQEMFTQLEHSYAELKELNESLEAKINARTKDLEKSKDELKYLASIDPMTKLYNRRYFSEISDELFTVNKKEHKSVSLIMLDIDNFKNVNDTYGHHIGDKVIIAIADILVENTRKNDIVCRYGGEEYMILLPETNMKRCIDIAEKIRVLIEELVIKFENDRELKVTISIGISMADMLVDNNIEIAINKADNAMYEAKKSGKNRVVKYTGNNS